MHTIPTSPSRINAPDVQAAEAERPSTPHASEGDRAVLREVGVMLRETRPPSQDDAAMARALATALAPSPAHEHLPVAQQRLSDAGAAYVESGSTHGLPGGTVIDIDQALHDGGLDRTTPSGRLCALMSTYRTMEQAMDSNPAGKFALNTLHVSARSLGSVALTTMARQAVGRALDCALKAGTDELTRTLLGAAFMAVPVVGQVVNLARDEMNGNATNYSRATRGVMIGLSVATGGLALGTGTLVNPGMRFAETVLYPLMRDSIQAKFPILSTPESGPTKTSLAMSGIAYALNQLGVSRAFAANPDGDVETGLPVAGGVGVRGLANAAGEVGDLMALTYANHYARHGFSSQPSLRVGVDDLGAAMKTQPYWDTAMSRGSFVSSFNQLYDTLLADNTLTRALTDVIGKDQAVHVADWLTEAIAAVATVATYPFWPDPLHARGATLRSLQEMEEGRAPPQFAGNHREPALADGGRHSVELTRYSPIPNEHAFIADETSAHAAASPGSADHRREPALADGGHESVEPTRNSPKPEPHAFIVDETISHAVASPRPRPPQNPSSNS